MLIYKNNLIFKIEVILKLIDLEHKYLSLFMIKIKI